MKNLLSNALCSAAGAALLSLSPVAGAGDPQDAEIIRDPAIDAIATGLAGNSVPGLAVLVVHAGEVLHRAAYGSAAIGEHPAAVGVHTPFYAASVAKMLTAAAVLLLVDEGRMDLDEPVSAYVGDLPDWAGIVSVRQLLDHTSGLPDYYELAGEERAYTTDEVLQLLGQAGALAFEPGTRAAYSNSGYVVLALAVEAVSGESFADFVRRKLFEPAAMNDAFVASDAGVRPPGRAIGYRRQDGGWSPWEYESEVAGPGGVYLSLADLEAWHSAQSSGRILDDELLSLASRPPELPGGRLTPYGMGWLAEFAARGPLADRWYVLAYGSLGGYRAAWQWYREDDLLIAWLANGDDDELLGAFHGVAERILAKPDEGP